MGIFKTQSLLLSEVVQSKIQQNFPPAIIFLPIQLVVSRYNLALMVKRVRQITQIYGSTFPTIQFEDITRLCEVRFLGVVTSYSFIFVHISAFVILNVYGKIRQQKPSSTIYKFLYQYFVLLKTILCIPTTILIAYLLNQTNFELYIVLPIATLGCLILSINSLITITFLRKFQFGNQQQLIPQFSYIQFIILIAETSLIFIQHLNLTKANVYVQIILNLVMWLILLRQEIVLQTSYPNHFCCLILNSTGLVVSVCILISIIADGFFGQENLVIFAMIAITFIIPIIVNYDEDRGQQILSLRFDSLRVDEHQVVQCVEQLYLTHKRTKTNPYYGVKLMHLYQIHRQFCHQESCELVFQSLSKDSQRLVSKGLLNFVITCVFQTSLSQRTNKVTIAHYLSIIYISFLQRQCNNPLNGYMELKHYQNQGDYYLKFLYECLDNNISQELIRIQQQKVIYNRNLNEEKTIQIKDINFCQGLEEKYIPMILDIMKNRMQIWENLIKGHKEIDDFKNELIQLGILIHKCRDDIQNDIKLDLESDSNWQQKAQNSIFALKILVMYYASVMNDQLSTYRGSQYIEEVLKFESMANSDKILNLTLLQDKVILVQISLHKQRGVIQNRERNSLAIFFGFQDELQCLHIQHLNQLLPDVFSKVHDQFLDHYLGEGKSSLFTSQKQVFINNSKGFCETVNLNIDNFFEIRDDYVLTGSLVKTRQTSQYIYFDHTGLINGISEEVFQQIQSVAQINVLSLIQSGYIYFLIPQLFDLIETVKENISQNKLDQRQVEKQIYLLISPDLVNILKKFQESQIIKRFQNQGINSKKQSRTFDRFASSYSQISQRTLKGYKSEEALQQINQSKIDGCHIQLFDQSYKTEIEDFMKSIYKDLEEPGVVEFQCRIQLTLNLFGYTQCRSSFFQLECLEVKRNNISQSGTSHHFFKTLSNSADKGNDLILKTQTYNPEKTSSIKSDEVQNLIVSELPVKASGFKNFNQDMINSMTFNQQKLQVIEQQTRNVHPQFRLPEINRDDDHEMIEFENDFNEIKIASPRGNENQEMQFLQQEEAEDVEINQQKSNSSAKKGQFSNSQNIVKLFKKKRNSKMQEQQAQDQMQVSRASSKTSYSNNMGLALVKTLQRRKGIISPITTLTFLNLLLFVVFFTILIINIIMAKQSIVSYSDAANRVIAPVQLNSYYCEVLTLSWILLYQKLGVYEYSEYLNKRFVLSSKSLQENIYKDFGHISEILFDSEQKKLISSVQINLLTGEKIQDVGITYFRDLTLSRFQSLIQFFLDPYQQLTQTEIEDILFLKDNFVQAQYISQNLISKLNDQQVLLLELNQSEMTLTISIEIIIISLLISTQIMFWFSLKKYQEQILLILTRVYEKDAQLLQTRIAVTKDILLRKTIQLWKQCDFYSLWFNQPSKKSLEKIGSSTKYLQIIQQNNQADIVNTKKQKHKRFTNTYLTSRVGNLSLPIQLPMIYLSGICTIITVYLVVSVIIYQQQQIQIYPAQQVCTNIMLFVNRLDALIDTSLILKTKVLVYDAIDRQYKLPEKFRINSYQGGEFLDAFEKLYQGYSQQVADIQLAIYSMDQMLPEDRIFLQFLFEKSFCDFLYDKLVFCSYTSNQKDQFIEKHGQFTEYENNYLFISQGMAAINTQYQTLTRMYFDKELKTKQYIQDKQDILQNLQTQQFTNAYIQYFLDTRKAYALFITKVIEAMKRMTDNYITQMAIYYIITWMCIVIISVFIAIGILKTSYRETEMLHLSLSNLPYELLNEKQTMTLLKGL